MSQLLQNAISILTNLLLWPVIILLLFGMSYALYNFGNMLVESYQRRGKPEAIKNPFQPSEFVSRLQGVQEWKKQLQLDAEANPWLQLDRTEIALKKRVDRLRVWVKFGPALGLAGTLIPLGTALAAMASNNLALLSNELSLAFGSTVLGLTSGVLSMIIVSSYERWYTLDIAEIRHALEAYENSVASTTFLHQPQTAGNAS